MHILDCCRSRHRYSGWLFIILQKHTCSFINTCSCLFKFP